MAERVFCIDLGSAFTKVSLRQDPGADSRLLTLATASGGEASFCFPTVVAVDRRGAKPAVSIGEKAADMQAGSGVEVYRNWKKWLFATPQASGRSHQSPLEALLESDELRQLADKFGVANGQIHYLQQLVVVARSLISGPGGRVVSAESQQHANAPLLTGHYLLALRQYVLEACNRLPATGLRYEAIPVRISVPAFALPTDADPHPACKILTDALQKAGWPLHPDRPIVAEPYSNAIGILTKATNILKRTSLDLGGMFSKGPVISVLKDPTHYPSYRALVMDVGAYTTDFAAVELKPGGDATANPDVGFSVRQQSVPLGISDLDTAIEAALPKEKSELLRRLKAIDWDDFRKAVYTDRKGVKHPTGVVIGGPSDEGAVSDTLSRFAGQLVAKVVTFCEELAPTGLQELILTGGGAFIPSIRDALIQAAQAGGQSYSKTHAPALKKTAGAPPVVKLDEAFTRGGSALGGTSIYFEKEYY